jgi:hypothetical protein
VFLRNNRWIGRYYVDVPGEFKRQRRAVVLGLKPELTKPEAKLKLLTLITTEGINTPEDLERSVRPLKTFNDVADAWESKRLPQLKESTQYMGPKLIAKYLRPFFGHTPPIEVSRNKSERLDRRFALQGDPPIPWRLSNQSKHRGSLSEFWGRLLAHATQSA